MSIFYWAVFAQCPASLQNVHTCTSLLVCNRFHLICTSRQTYFSNPSNSSSSHRKSQLYSYSALKMIGCDRLVPLLYITLVKRYLFALNNTVIFLLLFIQTLNLVLVMRNQRFHIIVFNLGLPIWNRDEKSVKSSLACRCYLTPMYRNNALFNEYRSTPLNVKMKFVSS